MGLNVPNSGPEFLASTGKIILYFGLDTANTLQSRHISMADADGITQAQFVQLDTIIRTGTVAQLIAELAKPHLSPWWTRVRTYIQQVYPQQAPITVFIGAWIRQA